MFTLITTNPALDIITMSLFVISFVQVLKIDGPSRQISSSVGLIKHPSSLSATSHLLKTNCVFESYFCCWDFIVPIRTIAFSVLEGDYRK